MAADPAIRFGTLANGMRYAILHNDTPPGQMAMRLYIGSGSLVETDAQEGLAHFIEHMAFRGSTHMGDGVLMQTLARHGLAFGADSNAETGQLATIYKFDFPHSTADDLDTGLAALREIASDLSFAQASVDAERGVILSEERLRDTPAMRATKAQLAFLFPGQPLADRLPIGNKQVIASATPDQLRAYYSRQYRPNNAVLVIVGNVAPDQVEARIRTEFGSWRNPAAATPLPITAIPPRATASDVALEAGAPQMMQLSWVRPYDPTPDTPAREARDLTRLIGAAILNERLRDLAQTDQAPFAAAAVSRSNMLKSADVTSLAVLGPSAHWQPALKAAVDEVNRAVHFGVTQPELDRVLGALRTAYTNALTGAATRSTPQLANAIVRDVMLDGVTTSPEQDLALFERLSAHLTPADVSAALASDFTGAGPLLFVSGAPNSGLDRDGVQTALIADLHDSVTAQAQAANLEWPYRSFGPSGKVVERKHDGALGLDVVRFANGTRLTIKHTSFSVGQVLVAANFGQGRAGVPIADRGELWLVPAVTDGGTQRLTGTQINHILAGHRVNVKLGSGDELFQMSGQTSAQDLDLELQLMASYQTDAAFRPQPVAQIQAAFAALLPEVGASATGVLRREAPLALHDGDVRWTAVPTEQEVSSATPATLKAIMAPAFGSGPVDVIIVGDVTPDEAIQAVSTTYGALRARASVPRQAPKIAFPGPTAQPVVFHHSGRADQAVMLTSWRTDDLMSNPKEAYTTDVLAEIIRQRLIDTVREKLGDTYTPSVQSVASGDIRGFGYLSAAMELPPERMPAAREALTAIVDDLKAKPVSPDELLRARGPLVDRMEREANENSFWLGGLTEAGADPAKLALLHNRASLMQSISSADVQRVAKAYLDPGRRYEMTILPTAAAPASATARTQAAAGPSHRQLQAPFPKAP